MEYQAARIRMFATKRRRKKGRGTTVTAAVIVISLYISSVVTPVQGQCFGGVEVYEKTAGVGFDASKSVPQGLVSQPGTALTRDCAALCKQTPNCAAFTVDYADSRCKSVDMDTVKMGDHVKDTPGVNYFEKVCIRRLSNFNTICGDRQWAFERVMGAALQAFDNVEESNIQSRFDCQRLCLEQAAFICRSAEYDESKQICRLSSEDRRTQPLAFRKDGSTWDYLENQCVRSLPDCRYAKRKDSNLVSMDQMEFAQSQGECESLCDQARVFTCRAYSFTADENRCYLSGDDSISHPTGNLLQSDSTTGKKSTVYAEKICSVSQCENGIFTFEKITGHFLRSARQEALKRPTVTTSPAVGDVTDVGITVDCANSCREIGADCPAYYVDYTQGSCFKLDRNSQGRAQELTVREGMSYFEKICLRGNIQSCRDNGWAFERYPGKELVGLDNAVLTLVASRRDCQEACLSEFNFVCRSAEYDTKTLQCKLSSSDKHSRPDVFVDAATHVEYLENRCGRAQCVDDWNTVEDMQPRYVDLVVSNVTDERSCRQLCSANAAFACRSYSFQPTVSQCLISSENRESAGLSAMQVLPGTNYTEKKCNTPPGGKRTTIISASGLSSGNSGNPASFGSSSSGVNIFVGPPNSGTAKPLDFVPFRAPTSADRFNNVPLTQSDKCAFPSRLHFQRVAGFEAVSSRFVNVRPMSSSGVAGRRFSAASALVDAMNVCTGDVLCQGFNFNSGLVTLDVVNMDVHRRNESVPLRPKAGVAYFESQCHQAPSCQLLWSTERTPGYFLRGFNRDVLRGISRAKCAESCLDERRFVCRSASYDTNRAECHLSSDDKFSQPQAFQTNPIYEYIENQCSSPEGRVCGYGAAQSDRYLLYADRMVSGLNEGACRLACDSERYFHCRSYSWHLHSSLACSLSSSTSSASNSYQFQRGATFRERECSSSSVNDVSPLRETARLGPNPNRGTAFLDLRPNTADSDGWVSLSGQSNSRVLTGNNGGNNIPVVMRPFGNSPPPLPPLVNPQPTDVVIRPIGVTRYNPNYQFYNTPDVGVPVSARPSLFNSDPTRCPGPTSYDKVANVDYAGVRRQELRLIGDASPTIECLRECDRMRERCLSVVMTADRFASQLDFSRNSTLTLRLRCFVLDRSASVDQIPLVYSPSSMYYEKTCFPVSDAGCGKAWSFIRVTGFELEGFDHEIITNVMSKEECQVACLRMSNKQCRSVEYVVRDRICRLSTENRRTQLHSFRASSPDTIYMENQCTNDPSHCDYADQDGRLSPWYDRIVALAPETSPAVSLVQCRRLCDEEQQFLCKSVSMIFKGGLCLLSSDDSISMSGVNGANGLIPHRDFTYSERASCSNVRVECTKSEMLVTLAFGFPFNGRVHATGNYRVCFEMGNGQNQLVLRIPLGNQCGTVQPSRNRYVNYVVIQQNPVIMQDSDDTIRVECAFEASEQTVSYSSGSRGNGLDGMGSGSLDVTAPFRQLGHNVVTNTAPTPAVRMRITSHSGQETRIVGLGEPLTLRIEIDSASTSAFGISARNVEARTDNGELLTLIDSTGCPKNAIIFPAMEVDRATKSLYADFKAFRFPSTGTINFVATVAFCEEQCEPTHCIEGWDSYGRRRRRDVSNSTSTEPIATTLQPIADVTVENVTIDDVTFDEVIIDDVTIDNVTTEVSDPTDPTVTPITAADDTTVKLMTESTSEKPTVRPSMTPPMTTPRHWTMPVEVPVHLQLIVGSDEVSRDPPLSPPPPATSSPIERASNQKFFTQPTIPFRKPNNWYFPSTAEAREEHRDESMCSATSIIIAVSSVAVLVQIIVAISFVVFYRSKRTAWRSTVPMTPFDGVQHPSGSVSEVTFRNVYGQKPARAGTLRASHLNDIGPSSSRCHIASLFQDP